MKLETKQNRGDKVWMMYDNRPIEIEILYVYLTIGNTVKEDYQYSKNGSMRLAQTVYSSKEELIKSI